MLSMLNVFKRETNTLLFLCVLSSVMTTSIFFVEIYSSISTPITQLSPSDSESMPPDFPTMNLFRKSLTPAVPLYPVEHEQSIDMETLLRSLSVPKYDNFRHRRHISVFKTWSQQMITRMVPSLGQNCSQLMAGNSTEMKHVTQFLNQTKSHMVFANLSNCTQTLHEFYDNYYVSQTERSFPIAFSLVVHTNAQQILRFLKAIYRPQNLYCIHPDLNAGEDFLRTFKLVSKCLPNVFMPSVMKKVDYSSTKTILEAQMSCFRDLEAQRYKKSRKWRYVLNLCGRELPLKTNRFIVEALSRLNGASILKANHIDDYTLMTRFAEVRYKVGKRLPSINRTTEFVERNEEFLQKYSIKLYKSMAYNALSFEFVQFLLHNSTAQLLIRWMLQNCSTPEEHLYATAYMIPGVPGGFDRNKSQGFPLISKSFWKHYKSSHYYSKGESCSGRSVHQVCILNSADLPSIRRHMDRNIWFLNKYFMEDDHIVIDCVEESLISANKQEFHGDYQ